MKPPASKAAVLRDRFAVAQALHQRGRLAEAEALYREILKLDPRHADALHMLGVAALQAGRAAEGVAAIEKAVSARQAYPEALANLGIGYEELGRPADALAAYDKALALRPGMTEVHDSRGNALRSLLRYQDAVASHDRAIALRPGDAGAWSNRGNALRDWQRYDEALASYDKATALQPGFAEAHCNRASVLHAMQRDNEALAAFDRAIALLQAYPEAQYGRGNVLLALHRPQDALAAFDRAIGLKPGYAEAHNSRGNALRNLHREQDALASYAMAIALVPTYAAPYYNTGDMLAARRRDAEALPWFDRAIAAWPEDANAHRVRGLSLAALRRYPEALAGYDRARALDPAMKWLQGDIIAAQRQICDWTREPGSIIGLESAIRSGEDACAPFIAIGVSDDPALHRRAAEIFVQSRYPVRAGTPLAASDRSKIHIGYFSADFRDHAMMHVMSGLFALHDRDRFDITCFSFGPDTGDVWRQKVAAGCDRFIDIRSCPDHEAAMMARDLRVDIAVDLMGFTQGCRTGIFAGRAAPVQVNYLGYPGTMGAGYIDYIVADDIVIPETAEQYYAENIVRLPGCYQVNTLDQPPPGRTPSRAEEGLPDSAFVYCCFNNTYKITPAVFDGWMRILHQAENSVLWLFEENPDAAANLKRAAATRGIAPERLVFARRLQLADHIARQTLADLFLDTWPYNGHATAGLALRAGLPVLTRIGRTFAGRVGASLLTELGLSGLITEGQHEYEARAAELARDQLRLQNVRSELQQNRLNSSVFDTALFARHLEAAFTAMHERARDGLPPVDIRVAALHDRSSIRR